MHVQRKWTGFEAVLLKEFIKQLASLLALLDEAVLPDSCPDSTLIFDGSWPFFSPDDDLLCTTFGFLRFEVWCSDQFRSAFNRFCFCLFLWRLDNLAIIFRDNFEGKFKEKQNLHVFPSKNSNALPKFQWPIRFRIEAGGYTATVFPLTYAGGVY